MPSKCSTHAAASLEQAATVSNSRTRLSRISPKVYCISKRLHSSLSSSSASTQFCLYAVLPSSARRVSLPSSRDMSDMLSRRAFVSSDCSSFIAS